MTRRPVRRNTNIWRQLDAASRHAWPASCMIFGLFIIGLPVGLPAQAELRPTFAMACVFFWSLYRPGSLPAPMVAVTGILLDLLGLSPLGLWAVLLLLLQGCTLAARRRLAPQAFWVTWAAFLGLASAFAFLAWALQSLLTLTLLPLLPLAAQIIACAGIYPALAALFIRAHRGAAAGELA